MTETPFSTRELDVMSVLWRLGSATVGEVKAELKDEPGYTSVLSVLQVLTEKGHVRHESEGRAYRYYPTVGAQEAGESALARIRDAVFDGSAERLFAQLVSDRGISRDELERMRQLLTKRMGEEEG